MSYYHYMYQIDKDLYKEIKGMTYEEILCKFGEDDYVSLDDIPQENIYNFGEMDKSVERIYKTGKPLFENKETMEYFEENKPYIINKEGLLTAIEIYKEKIIRMYQRLLSDDKELSLMYRSKEIRQERHIQSQLNLWEDDFMLCLNTNSECIVDSCTYEYDIFELVRLLKTIDWDNSIILFYGH